MDQPRNWKQLQRHPLSAQYHDIVGKTWQAYLDGLDEIGILGGRNIILCDGMVLDGWQLQRACVAKGIQPVYAELPNGVTAEQYVAIMNDVRRHETQEAAEQRIAARRERVAEARREGQSTRTIAENEDVSHVTVLNDIEEATGKGLPVTPPDDKITGKDERQQPATKPELLTCERCKRDKRVGKMPVKGCPMCKELRHTTKREPRQKATKEVLDAFRNLVPGPCQAAYEDPWIQSAIDDIAIIEEKLRMARLADGMAKRKKHYPFFNTKDFADGVGFAMNYLDQLLTHLKDNRPAGVCPSCSGAKCADCRMSGMVPRELYARLKK